MAETTTIISEEAAPVTEVIYSTRETLGRADRSRINLTTALCGLNADNLRAFLTVIPGRQRNGGVGFGRGAVPSLKPSPSDTILQSCRSGGTLVGVFFGSYSIFTAFNLFKTSNLNPIEALRCE